MRLWTEGIVSRVKAFLPAGGRKTVVMAAAGRLWLAEMEKGKYLAKKSAALPKITEESLAEAFSSLSGIGEREIILIYNSPDLHTACRTFPAMAEEELAESVGLEHGSISIGASEIALNIYLLDRLKKFHIAYPGVQLKIYNHSTPQAISAVRSGETDFAVITTPADVEAPLKEVRLKAFKDILIGGRTFTAMGSQELSLKDLKEYPYICLGKETTTYHFYNQLFLKYGVEIIPDTEAATTDQVLPLVKSELGLAFLPEEMTEEALAKHEIIQIRIKEEIPERYVCMVYDRKRPMSVAAQKLKQILDKGESYAEIK